MFKYYLNTNKSLLKCPHAIILLITSFLDDKTNINLMSTCKYIYSYGELYGFLKSIKLDYKENYINFIKHYNKHKHTIKKIEVNRIDNPHMWIPDYVETLVFSHCSIDHYLDPPSTCLFTKELILHDYNRYKNKNKLRINWECFKNIEILELYVYDVDIKGIEKLTKLRKKNIDTIISKKEIIIHNYLK